VGQFEKKFPSGAKQAAEKLRRDGERAEFGGCKTINQPSRIVPRASWRDPFFALFEKSSFSAACKAPIYFVRFMYGLKPVPFKLKPVLFALKPVLFTLDHNR
jgi:hypothetical protein